MKLLPQAELEASAQNILKRHLTETSPDFPRSERLYLSMGKKGRSSEYSVNVSGWVRGDAITLARVTVDQVTGEGVVEVFPEYFSEDTWPAIVPPGLEGVHGCWRGIS
jgi:hypothetical protein